MQGSRTEKLIAGSATGNPLNRYPYNRDEENQTTVAATAVAGHETQTVYITKYVTNNNTQVNQGLSLEGLIFIAGIVFWAHGNASHDAWFKDEAKIGMIATTVQLSLLACLCCCFCAAMGCGAMAEDSEENTLSQDVNNAKDTLHDSEFSVGTLSSKNMFSSVDTSSEATKEKSVVFEI